MSRRLSERALPDFSQLIDRDAQFSLLQRDEQRGAGQIDDQVGGWPRLFIGRSWLRTLAQVGHIAHRAGTPIPASPRIDLIESGESGAKC